MSTNAPTAWGPVQDVAYHLERAITKEVSAVLLLGGGLVPQARAVLREAGDFLQMAVKDVEALPVKGKKRKAAQAEVLKRLKAAEKKGIDAAKLLFQEKIAEKDVSAICASIGDAITREMEALNSLLALRE
jgi:hypothetical protein